MNESKIINIKSVEPVNIKPIDEIKKKIISKTSEDGVYHDGKKLLYEADEEFELRSCCGSMCTIDKPFLEFLAKTIVALSVLSFCFIQLSKGSQSEFASSTISLILGTYLGSHSSSEKNKKQS